MSFAEEQIPKTEFTGFDFEFLDDGYHGLPPCLGITGYLSMGNFDGG
jgi:hypothetical protein